VVPGATAIRALARVALLLLVPLSIGLAWMVETRRRAASALLIGAICVVEQGHTTSAYDKLAMREEVRAVANAVETSCTVFYYSPVFPLTAAVLPAPYKLHLDAMWATLETGVPTINGYAANAPPGWGPLWDNEIVDEDGLGRLRDSLLAWTKSHGLDPARVCWVGPSAERARLAP